MVLVSYAGPASLSRRQPSFYHASMNLDSSHGLHQPAALSGTRKLGRFSPTPKDAGVQMKEYLDFSRSHVAWGHALLPCSVPLPAISLLVDYQKNPLSKLILLMNGK